MIVAINEVERQVMLDTGYTFPIVQLYRGGGEDREKVTEWEDATHFMAGPISIDVKTGEKRWILAEIAALTTTDVAN